jgi:hypothetical protein
VPPWGLVDEDWSRGVDVSSKRIERFDQLERFERVAILSDIASPFH